LLLSLGTLLDDGKEGATSFEKLLNAFSLKRNLKKVFDLSDAPSSVKGVDSFRGLNALALLVVHKSMAMAHNPYVNKANFAAVSNFLIVLCMRTSMYTYVRVLELELTCTGPAW
jgi:hypothetical protein